MKKISIIIPAYNEEHRITRTLIAYINYFNELVDKQILDYEITVVLNGCTDNTLGIVKEVQKTYPKCHHIHLHHGGKGLAIQKGFLDALERDNDIIGFVDADMATSPQAFYNLIENLPGVDGVIASRYMQGSKIHPQRPWIKRWGSKLIYEPLVRALLKLRYKDLQCGAKIFNRNVIEVIAPLMTMTKWAIDAEILYLCRKFGFTIKEIPTEWYDQAGSKLSYASGIRMLSSIVKLRLRNSIFKNFFKK